MKDLLDENLIEQDKFEPNEVKFSPIDTIQTIKDIEANNLLRYDV